jgi:hypothetical protein
MNFKGIDSLDSLIKTAEEDKLGSIIESAVEGDSSAKDSLFKLMDEFDNKNIYGSLQKLLIGKIGDISVYTVNGDYVKLKWLPDYTEGGNFSAYPEWVPENEIWISNNSTVSEYKFILAHELIESWLMKNKGMKYDNPDEENDLSYAHPNANKIEMEYRKRKKD